MSPTQQTTEAATSAGDEPGCTQQHYSVTREDLPLSCPLPSMRVWDAHPRIYLAIEATGSAVCSYCGAKFTLVDDGTDAASTGAN